MVGIYIITNKTNGKSYIGQSVNIKKRIQEHFWKAHLPNEISYNSALHQAIRKYGDDNFEWRILEECSTDVIDERERILIQEYNTLSPNGYNILDGGQKYRAEPKRCLNCGTLIDKGSIYCVECAHLLQRRCVWPDRNTLKNEIRIGSFTGIAKKYGVTDNAVRKWCKKYNLPSRIKDIRAYSNEEWALI